MTRPREHNRRTEKLARLLDPANVYQWLVTSGYFPESYILPPCFYVSRHPRYGKRFSRWKKGKFMPPIYQVCEVDFPKTDLTDRTFGIIAPEIHSDIASEIAENWKAIINVVFNPKKHVYTYSFPIPVTSKKPGVIGSLRAGRMIYEWIEMAEDDLVEEAYRYKYLVRADVKNFYPSVYTHSIAWALHSRVRIRKDRNRYDFSYLGNRLDKLFQNASDGCTNGLPIGPVVSDLVAEIILSSVDMSISKDLSKRDILALRFKDDYRFLCRTREECRFTTKLLQKGLKAFNLLLNEDKTEISELPEGVFREWVSRYHRIRPKKGRRLTFKEFKELYLSVLRIDREVPGTGIIDRFIADVVDDSYRPLFPVSVAYVNRISSLLLLLGQRRIKSFPRILGLLESMMVSASQRRVSSMIKNRINNLLTEYAEAPEDNRYVISWLLYFLRSNKLAIRTTKVFSDPILESVRTGRNRVFDSAGNFKLFQSVLAARRSGLLLKHLDVFKPQ